MHRSVPINYFSNPVKKNKSVNAAYLQMRRDSIMQCNREVKAGAFSGQGCADVYPRGYPLK